MNPGYPASGFPQGIPPAGFPMMPQGGMPMQGAMPGHPGMMMQGGVAQGYGMPVNQNPGHTAIGGGRFAGPANQYMAPPTSNMSTNMAPPMGMPYMGGMPQQYGMYPPQPGMPYFTPQGLPAAPPPYSAQMNYRQAAPVGFPEFGGPGAAPVGVQEELSEEERKKMVAEQKRRQFDEQKRRLAEFGAVGGRTMNADALIESIIGSKADRSVPGKKPEISVAQGSTVMSSAGVGNTVVNDEEDDFGDFLSVPTVAAVSSDTMGNNATGSMGNVAPANQMIDSSSSNQVQAAAVAVTAAEAAAPVVDTKKDLLAMMTACSDLTADKTARGFTRKPTSVNQISVNKAQPITYSQSKQAVRWSTVGQSDHLSQMFTLPNSAPPESGDDFPDEFQQFQEVPTSATSHPVGIHVPPQNVQNLVSAPPLANVGQVAPPPNVANSKLISAPPMANTGHAPPQMNISIPASSVSVSNINSGMQEGSNDMRYGIKLPRWATGELPVPDVYTAVLKASQRGSVIDTGLLYPHLLSSGLARETLGHLWELCSKEARGSLIEPELYLMLAMISVAQNNMDYRTLDILTRCPQPPIPNLPNFNSAPSPIPSDTSMPHGAQARPQPHASHSIPDTSSGKALGLNKSDVEDDFADFQSANVTVHSAAAPQKPSVSWGGEPVGGDLLGGEVGEGDKYAAFREVSSSIFSDNTSNMGVLGLDDNTDNCIGLSLSMETGSNFTPNFSDGMNLSVQNSALSSGAAASSTISSGSNYTDIKSLVSNSSLFSQTSELKPSTTSKGAQPTPATSKGVLDDDWDDFQGGSSWNTSDFKSADTGFKVEQKVESGNFGGVFGGNARSSASFNWGSLNVNNSGASADVVNERQDTESGQVFELDKVLSNPQVTQEGLNDTRTSSKNKKEETESRTDFTKLDDKSKNKLEVGKPLPNTVHGFFRSNEQNKNFPVGISPLDFAPPDLPDDDDFEEFSGYHSTAKSGLHDIGGVSTLTGLDDDFDGFVGTGQQKQPGTATSEGFSDLGFGSSSSQKISMAKNTSEASLEFTGWSARQDAGKSEPQEDTKSTGSLDFGSGAPGAAWQNDDSPHDTASLSSGDLATDASSRPQRSSLGGDRGLAPPGVKPDGLSVASLDLKGEETGSVGRGSMGGVEGMSGSDTGDVGVEWGVNKPLDVRDVLDVSSGFGALGDRYCGLSGPTLQEGDRHAMEWTRCMERGGEMLREAESVLSDMSDSGVMTEVINTQHGITYLNGIYEIYCVLKRICEEMAAVSVSTARLQTLSAEVDSHWSKISTYLTNHRLINDSLPCVGVVKFDRSAVLKADDEDARDKACGVCLLNVDWSPSSQSQLSNTKTENTAKLTYGGRAYHASCANFWVNRVDLTLPALNIPQLL